jgi:tetratricopeptide (TPR) repeat protein
MEAAGAALRKAKGVYAKTGDHGGLADVAIDLAILAMARNNTHAARGFLVDALREAKSTPGLSDSDQATIYGIKGTLAARARDFAAAISDYQQSIDFWIRARGPKSYLVAAGYALRANAYLETGDYSKANADITAALVLAEQTVGRDTPLYAETELTYVRLLRATGANAEATRRETEAKATLETIRRQLCNSCSMSAASFK